MEKTLPYVRLPAAATNHINFAQLDSLDALATEFRTWRNNKKSRSEKIPDELLNKARALTGEFKHSTINKRLNLSGGQLNSQKAKSSTSSQHRKNQAPSKDQFIQLPDPVATPPHNFNAGLSVDIVTAQGVCISVSGLMQQNPVALLSQILGDVSC